MKANRFNSDTLKKAINTKIKRIITHKTIHNHLASALLHVENAHKSMTTQIARMISWIKLMVNHIREKAAPEKKPFFMCCGNITFID